MRTVVLCGLCCLFLETSAYARDGIPIAELADVTILGASIQDNIGINMDGFGDINGDDIVDMRDIGAIVIAYGSFPGHARWNPEADMNNDNTIDMRDVALTARNFGRCA